MRQVQVENEVKIEPYFQAYKCSDYEAATKEFEFYYKGQIEDFKFQGPGLFKSKSLDSDDRTKEICISERYLVENERITQIVSNFKNGKPDGQTKMTFSDGSVVIGHFKDGFRHGLFRRWNPDGSLYEIGYRVNDMNVGKYWKSLNGTYYLVDPTLFTASQGEWDQNYNEILMITTDKRVVIGDFLSFIGVAVNARYAEIERLDLSGCIMIPKAKKTKGKSLRMRVKNGDISYDESGINYNCPMQKEWNTVDVEGQLKQFIAQIPDSDQTYIWLQGPSKKPILKKAVKFIDKLEHVKDFDFQARLLDGQEMTRLTLVAGRVDHKGQLQGVVRLQMTPSVHFPLPPVHNLTFKVIHGLVVNGQFQDMVLCETTDGRYMVSKIQDSVLHGPGIVFGKRPVFPVQKEYLEPPFEPMRDLPAQSGLGMLMNFESGVPTGPVWIGVINSGYLYGELNEKGLFTGDKMAFVYVDLKTALYGRFEDNVMKAGQESEVVGERCNKNGIKVLKFAKPHGEKLFYSPPTNETFGEGPQVQDPYEAKMVKLAKSNVPHGGQGVFALKDIANATFICPYAGIVFRNPEEKLIYEERYLSNKSLSDDQRRWAKKYSIGIMGGTATIEIPIELDVPGVYHPTLGHKINCDFPKRGRNVAFGLVEHPRWGLIQGVHALKDIKAGQELFADYGYRKAEFPLDFPWYHEAKKEYEKELLEKERKEKETEMKKEKRKKKKQKN